MVKKFSIGIGIPILIFLTPVFGGCKIQTDKSILKKANQAEAFFSLMEYLKYVKSELKSSYDLVQNSIKKHGTINYMFPWLNIDDEGIKTKEFQRKLLKF